MTLETRFDKDGWWVVDTDTDPATKKDGPWDFAEDAEIRWLNMLMQGVEKGESPTVTNN